MIFWGLINNNDWQPGIGDPSLMGWLTVFAYFLTAFLCFNCWRRNRYYRWFWLMLSLILFLLGINKQLDLQSWLTILGKNIAIQQGWYEQRRHFQKEFILGLITVSFASLMFLVQAMGKALKSFILPLFGVSFLLIFIVIRATSFHYVDRLLGFELAGFHLNWLFELGGIICIAIAAIREMLNRKRRSPF